MHIHVSSIPLKCIASLVQVRSGDHTSVDTLGGSEEKWMQINRTVPSTGRFFANRSVVRNLIVRECFKLQSSADNEITYFRTGHNFAPRKIHARYMVFRIPLMLRRFFWDRLFCPPGWEDSTLSPNTFTCIKYTWKCRAKLHAFRLKASQ